MPTLPSDGTAQVAAERTRREQAETALAAAEARITELEYQLTTATHTAQQHHHQLIALVQNLQTGLVLVDSEGVIQFVNQPFRDLFGLAPDAVLADTAPPDPPRTISIADAFQDPAAFAARVHVLHKAGRTALHEEFTLHDGRVVELDYLVLDQAQAGRLICYRDVSKRYQRDAQLRALAYIPEQNPNPILRLTAAGDVLYANPAAAALAQTFAAASEQEGTMRQQLLALIQTALRGSEPLQQELAVATHYYLLTVVAVPDEIYATLYFTDITERRRAEQELVDQRQFYEMILEQVPAAIAVFDPEHRYLFANPVVEPDPTVRAWLLGKDNFQSCAQRQRPYALAERRQTIFAQAMSQQQEVKWEEAILQTGLGLRHYLRSFRPVVAADGVVHFIVSSGLDITERHQAETQLAEQKIFAQQIMDTISSLLCVTNSHCKIIFANEAFIKFFQLDANEMNSDCTRIEHYQEFITWNQKVLLTQEIIRAELPFTLANGEIRHYQMEKRPLRQADGSMAVLTLHTDVTELKRTRQQAEQRQKQYHDLVRYSQALICTHDLQGVLLSVNPAIERLMGLTAKQLVGRNLAEALPPKHQAALQAYLAGASQLQPSVTSILTVTGEKRYLHYYTYQVTEEGYPPYVVASGYDITQGVEAARLLQQAKQEAEENAQAKEAFLARMSHEIRTPLNGVLGMAGLLEKTPLTSAQHAYLSTMKQAGQHLLALVNDVLDMAKITANDLQLEHASFDVRVLLQGAQQTVLTLAEPKGLLLTIEPLPDSIPWVLGDAYRLHQVLLNLLSNAIKFTEQGSVHLGARVLRQTPQALTIRFWVEDTGLGIPPEQQDHIFESFMQGNKDISRRFGGTGLGLTISQQLVQHMGGSLLLCSVPEQGTTFAFTLTLPLAAGPMENLLPPDEPAQYEDLNGLRVLLAEDNLVNQWIATVMLEHWGVLVYAVSNGTDALAQLQSTAYDVAILDIQMPGHSGVEVTTIIRQHPDPTRAAIPILALTANAFEADQAEYLAAGMNACLTKPFEEGELCQLLLQLTGK